MKTMSITDFKAHASKVVSEVAEHKEPVRITRRGKPVAELIPYSESKSVPGKLANTLVYENDIVSPLGEKMWDACGCECE